MASYLLAFIVSDLQFISNAETKTADETLHRIWVRPDSLKKAKYALDNSIGALKALENFVGMKYEMEKVDSAGVPNKSGAMENWVNILSFYYFSYLLILLSSGYGHVQVI